MVITTETGFNIIKILNKLGMVTEITDTFSKLGELEQKKTLAYSKLRTLIEEASGTDYDSVPKEDVEKLSQSLLAKNPEVQKEILECNSESSQLMSQLMITGVMRLPQAEKEVYKTLANIYGITEKEASQKGLDWTINAVKEIASSETFQTFFNLAIK